MQSCIFDISVGDFDGKQQKLLLLDLSTHEICWKDVSGESVEKLSQTIGREIKRGCTHEPKAQSSKGRVWDRAGSLSLMDSQGIPNGVLLMALRIGLISPDPQCKLRLSSPTMAPTSEPYACH